MTFVVPHIPCRSMRPMWAASRMLVLDRKAIYQDCANHGSLIPPTLCWCPLELSLFPHTDSGLRPNAEPNPRALQGRTETRSSSRQESVLSTLLGCDLRFQRPHDSKIDEVTPLPNPRKTRRSNTALEAVHSGKMHFAYPPRKDSNPPPFRPRTSKVPLLRPSRLRTILLLVLTIVGFLWLLSGPRKEPPYREHVPSGNPPVVILTVVDPTKYSDEYLKTITDNREQYAAKHGYVTMIVKLFDYQTDGAPQSWARIFAMRHALSLYPESKFIWFLDQNAYIMELDKSLEDQLTDTTKLESLMIRDRSIVPPDSIIKTFNHLKGDDAAFIISQDEAGLVINSFLIRNGDWAKFFIETWMDPLYRSYNFQKAERHALEHIVQWHPTILSKLALVPQRTIASYGRNKEGNSYRDGDFVALLIDCHPTGPNSCDKQSQSYLNQLRTKAAAAEQKS